VTWLFITFPVIWLGGGILSDRLVVDLNGDGQAGVLWCPGEGLPNQVSSAPLVWPLDADALEDLRWYLEDYLLAPFGVWEDRGPLVEGRLAGWGEEVFRSVFGAGAARIAYEQARDQHAELVFRSGIPALLGLPWELMRDGTDLVALGAGGISRSLPVAGRAGTLEVPGGRLRVLMVISRPAGTDDVGYRMVARPLLERLAAVRGNVALTVLRPPTIGRLREVVRQAAEIGEPFHAVHFDGHGVMPARSAGGAKAEARPGVAPGSSEGVLAFELPDGGRDLVGASIVSRVLAEGRVPVAVLNACQSGAVGKELEASVATALLNAGCEAVVAMAYSVYAVAAAEFMAAFYESLFTGASVGQAVVAGRRQLSLRNGRPSPKGYLPLADWLVPVHYMRRDVRFPQARTARSTGALSLEVMLDQLRAGSQESAAAQDPLAETGSFVGRDDLFYQMEIAARLQRVVVFTGPGGTGKTELAKGFARWWRDTGGVDDQRLVLWHSFEPGIASFGLDAVITQIGLAVFGADFALLDPPQRLDTVKHLLSQSRALLVWDNFESVREMPDPAGVTPPLDEAQRAALKSFLEWVRDYSASVVIITSRAQENWLGQVRRIPVGGLNRVEAAQYASILLVSYPAAQRRQAGRPFGELLEWLDGHPLAMRLTLPRLDATGPSELLADLRGTIPLPVEDALDADRTTSLPASITYSYAHLSDRTRHLLPVASLVHGIADEDLLTTFSTVEGIPARFAGVSTQEWTAVLEDATRVGLLTGIGGGMYQIHPALPGYLAASWRAVSPAMYSEERESCERALCSACGGMSSWLAQQLESGDASLAYTLIGLQQRTLGAMLGSALDRQAWEDANHIFRALDAYWGSRGYSEEGAAWAGRILDATAGHQQDPSEAVQSLWVTAMISQAGRKLQAGQPDQAEPIYRRALAYLQGQHENPLTRASIGAAYHLLGNTAYQRRDLDEAESWYRQALTISEELGDRSRAAASYHQLGMTVQERGQLDEADGWYRKALTVEEDLGNRPGMAHTYHQFGITAYLRDQLDEAENWFRRSLAIEEELGNRPGIAQTCHEFGNVAQDRGELDQAEEWYRRSLTIEEDLGNRPGMAITYYQLGNIAYLRGRLNDAEEWYRRSLTFEEDLGNRPGMAGAYHQLGMIAQDRTRLDEAEDWYHKALTIEEESGDIHSMALTCAQLGLLYEDRAQAALALEWYIRGVSLFTEFPSPLTGTGPAALARLTGLLGIPALEDSWQRVTGQPLPDAIRNHLTSGNQSGDTQ